MVVCWKKETYEKKKKITARVLKLLNFPRPALLHRGGKPGASASAGGYHRFLFFWGL